MASQGAAKWAKYFKNQEVPTVIKAKPGELVPIFNSAGKVITKLRDGAAITVLAAPSYEPKYHIAFLFHGKNTVAYISEKYVAKPLVHTYAPSLSAASALTFAKYGIKRTIQYMDREVKVSTFTSAKQIENSIIAGISHIEKDKDAAQHAFLDFFIHGYKQIPWTSETTPAERNRYGTYIGELLVGLYYLEGKASTVMSPLPDPRQAKAFHIPTDPQFSGIDSLIEFADGTYLPISSKFGFGARASLFSNVMAKGMLQYGRLQESVFRDLCIAAEAAGVSATDMENKRKSMPVVYEYGIANILGLVHITNKMAVYEALKAGNMTDAAIEVVSAIKHSGLADDDVLQNLPRSVTAFFCRTIAQRLNADQVSQQQMITILSGKQYWQANLNEASWQKGYVTFKMSPVGSMTMRVFGNKAAVSDISAKQGTVNYEIRSV